MNKDIIIIILVLLSSFLCGLTCFKRDKTIELKKKKNKKLKKKKTRKTKHFFISS